ncbi:MAG: UDP-N-acetylmuramoyl-tripeptide--D-alanyl-D-alanine ligase [Alphaproteobacteria bacterium]|nr:UDP-N-acetylmuramoyl-tripeptide--D-alanyl-D-alanine ligase [Alphaproteobacteria bacterium]
MIFSKEELSQIFSQDVCKDVYGISINSKEVQKGDLFIALRGEKTNGHKFIKDAIEHGASLALTEENTDSNILKDNLIYVSSTYEALRKLAKYNLSESTSAKYLAVTGSVGKTTTKNMIFHILDKNMDKSEVYVSKKNYNSQIGMPICAALMPRNTKIAIFEMGMSSFGNIKKLVDLVKPSVALITNIGENHLESFESQFDIAKAKSEIFENGADIAIIPNDSPYADFLKEKAKMDGIKNVITFGQNKESDIRILSSKLENGHITAEVAFLGKVIKYKLNCENIAFVWNSVAAITAAHVISNIDIEKLVNSIESFQVTKKRNEVIHLNKKNITLIDDSYNASPISVKWALRSLGLREHSGRKIAVIGDMLCLGANSRYFHENLAPTIDKYGIDRVFTCGNMARYFFENLRTQKKGDWKKNSHDLAESILKDAQDNDCILIKGSNAMNMDYIVNVLKEHFA